MRAALDDELRALNGTPGNPHSFDRSRRCWRSRPTASPTGGSPPSEINYRRFFDINDLAAIRIEEPEVLEAVHAKAFQLLARGHVTGLRIDHVDGLCEPRRYLEDLQRPRDGEPHAADRDRLRGGREDPAAPKSAADAPVTGDHGLRVPQRGQRPLRFTPLGRCASSSAATAGAGGERYVDDLLYRARSSILRTAMSSELHVLARRLDRISEQHRWSRDFTLSSLHLALGEAIACFPVYRTYAPRPTAEIASRRRSAARPCARSPAAKRRNPLDQRVDLRFPLRRPADARSRRLSSERQRAERRELVLRLQQLTGPVMAKGLEDTAFYRYYPLLSLNEVGGGPTRFGPPSRRFPRTCARRARAAARAVGDRHPRHQARRGQRARIDVLSEIPEAWGEAVSEWRELAGRLKPMVDGAPCPDTNDEYYIYQTLLGAWPYGALDDDALAAFGARLRGAIEKAMREAKRNTSWISPNEAYEEATHAFVARLLDPRGPLHAKLATFIDGLRRPAQLTSLAQLVVKLTAPGVPDFYQGTELWDFEPGRSR